MFDLQGKIIVAMPPRSGQSKTTGSAWTMQSFVLETKEQYPKHLQFDVWGEERLNEFAIKAGDNVKISFNIDAREFNGRWYNSMTAFKVEHVEVKQPETGNPADDPFAHLSAPVDFSPEEGADPFPF